MKASLGLLKDALGRKIAVLGDMGELGSREAQLHAEVGAFAAGCGLDLLVCAGPLCAHMAQAAREGNPGLPVVYLENREQLMERLPGLLRDGDTILVRLPTLWNMGRLWNCWKRKAREESHGRERSRFRDFFYEQKLLFRRNCV